MCPQRFAHFSVDTSVGNIASITLSHIKKENATTILKGLHTNQDSSIHDFIAFSMHAILLKRPARDGFSNSLGHVDLEGPEIE